jgi:hypothetical protein
VPQSELGRAATSETAAKYEGERKQVGNQLEPSGVLEDFAIMEIPLHASTRDQLPFAPNDVMCTTLGVVASLW